MPVHGWHATKGQGSHDSPMEVWETTQSGLAREDNRTLKEIKF